MDLYEYQGKQYFARFGIPTSPGGVADTVDEAVEQAEAAGYPVVVKAQVKVGGRGKAGGVKLAADADEVRLHAGNILGLDIKGHVVKRLWIEHASDIAREYYASFTLDRPAKLHLGMLSAEGGVEIEEVAETTPDAIAKLHVDPGAGLSEERQFRIVGSCERRMRLPHPRIDNRWARRRSAVHWESAKRACAIAQWGRGRDRRSSRPRSAFAGSSLAAPSR